MTSHSSTVFNCDCIYCIINLKVHGGLKYENYADVI